MQKRVYLMSLIGLALFMAISLIVITISGVIFPVQAESRVAIVFNDAISKNNFVEATEGAQRILNTMVNVADFAEVKNKVINSGFAVTDNVFYGGAKENATIWGKYVRIRPVNGAFVLRITTGGRNYAEAEELAVVIAHEISLEVPKLFTNLRGISDQPRPVNHLSEIIFACSFAVIIIAVCFLILLNFCVKNKKVVLPRDGNLNGVPVFPDKKQGGEDPRYFLQKFLEEHQKQKVD